MDSKFSTTATTPTPIRWSPRWKPWPGCRPRIGGSPCLGKMAELGEASDAGHRRVGEAAATGKIDFIIGVGPEAELIVNGARDAGHQQSWALSGTGRPPNGCSPTRARGSHFDQGEPVRRHGTGVDWIQACSSKTPPTTDAPTTATLSHALMMYYLSMLSRYRRAFRTLAGFRVFDLPWAWRRRSRHS